jgi:hypothetical protein
MPQSDDNDPVGRVPPPGGTDAPSPGDVRASRPDDMHIPATGGDIAPDAGWGHPAYNTTLGGVGRVPSRGVRDGYSPAWRAESFGKRVCLKAMTPTM